MNSSQRNFFVMAVLLLVSVLGGCTAAPVGYSDFDVQTDFSGFKSFAWVPDRTLVASTPNPINPALEPTIKEEVKRYLSGRGFRYVSNPDDADFVIGFTVGGTPTVRSTAFTDNYRQAHIFGTGISAVVVNQESSEGGLVIDLYEAGSGQKKWMGWSQTEVTMGDQVNLKPLVNQLVNIILQHFPPDV